MIQGAILYNLTKYAIVSMFFFMKTLPVAEVRSHFSSLLKEVEGGEEIGISFGKKKETIAVIVPIQEYKKIKTRKLGTLEGKVTVKFSSDWKMTEEEFLNS